MRHPFVIPIGDEHHCAVSTVKVDWFHFIVLNQVNFDLVAFGHLAYEFESQVMNELCRIIIRDEDSQFFHVGVCFLCGCVFFVCVKQEQVLIYRLLRSRPLSISCQKNKNYTKVFDNFLTMGKNFSYKNKKPPISRWFFV